MLTGRASSWKLATATGGASGTRTARVQWGDASYTADATVTTSGATTTVSGTHTWTAAGVYTAHVTVSDGQSSTTVPITVTVKDPVRNAITATPAAGVLPGAVATVTGIGFHSGEKVDLLLRTPTSVAKTVTADAQGRIIATFTVPARTPAGTYAVLAIGQVSEVPATATVSVLDDTAVPTQAPKPTLVLSTTSGTPGEIVTANGTGYRPNESVTVTVGSITVKTVRANGDGVVDTTFVVPQVGLGSHTVAVTGARSAVRTDEKFGAVAVPHGVVRR